MIYIYIYYLSVCICSMWVCARSVFAHTTQQIGQRHYPSSVRAALLSSCGKELCVCTLYLQEDGDGLGGKMTSENLRRCRYGMPSFPFKDVAVAKTPRLQ